VASGRGVGATISGMRSGSKSPDSSAGAEGRAAGRAGAVRVPLSARGMGETVSTPRTRPLRFIRKRALNAYKRALYVCK